MPRTVLCALVAFAVFVPRLAKADCGYFQACAFWQHRFDATPENSDYAHADCQGPCGYGHVCHPICDGSFANAPGQRAKYIALLDAADRGDVSSVLRLAVGLPGYAAYNKPRQAVQIRSCTGEIIVASLPVRSAVLRQVASRLPAPATMLAGAARFAKNRVGP